MKRISGFVLMSAALIFLAFPNVGSAVLSGSSTNGFPYVGAITDNNGILVATGIAIADGWVLTAAHVAQAIGTGASFSVGSQLGGTSYSVSQSYPYPLFNNDPNGYNLGLLSVSGLHLTSYPYLLDRSVGSADMSRNVTLVGLGVFDSLGHDGQKYTGTTTLTLTDYYGFLTDGGAKAEAGDGGAPGFFTTNNTLVLAGVVSYGDPSSGQTRFTQVAALRSFIDGEVGSGIVQWGVPANPVPIPGAVWLLGSGLLGLIGIRRRFKKLN